MTVIVSLGFSECHLTQMCFLSRFMLEFNKTVRVMLKNSLLVHYLFVNWIVKKMQVSTNVRSS